MSYKYGFGLLFILFAILTGLFYKHNFFDVNLPNNQIQVQSNETQQIDFENVTGQIYWTPGHFDFYNDLLSNTNKTLYLQIYTLTYDKIYKIFKDLASKGVNIKIITEKNKYKEFGSGFEELKTKLNHPNIQIKSDEELGINYLHSKFLLIDKEKFVIQTANLTYSSFYKNREYFFVSYNKAIYESLKKIFEKDFNGKAISKDDIHRNLLVCNIDCRPKLENLFKSAQKSIYLHSQNLEDKSIIQILKSKQNIDFKAVLADSEKSLTAEKIFGEDKIKILKKPYIHAKAFLVDDKYLVLGSINLTKNSLDNNREVSIVLTDKELINNFKKVFFQDFGD